MVKESAEVRQESVCRAYEDTRRAVESYQPGMWNRLSEDQQNILIMDALEHSGYVITPDPHHDAD